MKLLSICGNLSQCLGALLVGWAVVRGYRTMRRWQSRPIKSTTVVMGERSADELMEMAHRADSETVRYLALELGDVRMVLGGILVAVGLVLTTIAATAIEV